MSNSINAEIGQPYVMMPLFTAEEVLFNQAEAFTYVGKTDSAIYNLNLFASKRINNYSAASHTLTTTKLGNYYGGDLPNNLINCILDWKRVEFIQEGMRWFDILRYKIPVTHEDDDEKLYQLPANSPMRVFKLPDAAVNAGLKQNPRK